MEGPVEHEAGGGVAELRGGEEAAADGDKAVGMRRTRLVAELLVAVLQVPAAYAGVNGRRRQHHLHCCSTGFAAAFVLAAVAL